MYISGVKIVIK